MGYYVNITNSNFHMLSGQKEQAYKAVCAINDPKYNHLKRGGSSGPDGKSEHWYSWMPADYPSQTETLEDVLELLGFELWHNSNGDIVGLGYDNKTGNEEIFFLAMAPYVTPESWVMWTGEDHANWAWEFAEGTMYLRSVEMRPAGERTSITYLHVNDDVEIGNDSRYEYRKVAF